MTALMRLLLIIPGLIYIYAFAILSYLVFFPYFILDVLTQLIIGGQGLPGQDSLAAVRVWMFENQQYLLFGIGGWKWLP